MDSHHSGLIDIIDTQDNQTCEKRKTKADTATHFCKVMPRAEQHSLFTYLPPNWKSQSLAEFSRK